MKSTQISGMKNYYLHYLHADYCDNNNKGEENCPHINSVHRNLFDRGKQSKQS